MNEVTLERPQLVGFAGIALLVLGAFAPLVHLPFVGSINYVANGRGDGMLVLLLAAISAYLVFTRRYRGLLITATLTAAICIFTLVRFESALSDAHAKLASLGGGLFGGLADTMMGSIGLDWGWALLLLGICGLYGAVFLAPRPVG